MGVLNERVVGKGLKRGIEKRGVGGKGRRVWVVVKKKKKTEKFRKIEKKKEGRKSL